VGVKTGGGLNVGVVFNAGNELFGLSCGIEVFCFLAYKAGLTLGLVLGLVFTFSGGLGCWLLTTGFISGGCVRAVIVCAAWLGGLVSETSTTKGGFTSTNGSIGMLCQAYQISVCNAMDIRQASDIERKGRWLFGAKLVKVKQNIQLANNLLKVKAISLVGRL
jgi:hypothetical protein